MTQRDDADQAERDGLTAARRRRRAVRVVASGVTSCALAMGFLASSVASVPWNTFPSHRLDAAAPEPVSVGRIGGTATLAGGPKTVAQVLELIERAERAAIEAGHVRNQEIEQAAAELGMLLATYTAQQRAIVEPRVGLVPPRDGGHGGLTPVAPEGALPVADASLVDRDVLDGDAAHAPAAEPTPTTPIAPEPIPAVDPHDSHVHGDETVAFDDVVVAAMRLANLLDPATASFVTDILPAGGLSPAASSAVRAELTESLLAVVERYAGTTAGYENGQIPTSVLCPLDFAPGHRLRCDAAEQLTKLSAAYEATFGVPIPITDSYRSYDAQVAVRAAKPHLAAVPGTSNHGWGLAVDLSHPIAGGTSVEYVWLRVHGPDYGWDNPAWARPDGSKPEPWHFEFFAAGPVPDRAWSSTDVRTGSPSLPLGGKGSDDERPAGTPGGRVVDDDATPATPVPTPSPVAPVKPSPSAPSPSPTPAPTVPVPSPSPTPPRIPTEPSPTEPIPTPDPTELDPTEPDPTELDPTEPDPTELDPTEPDPTELDPTELDPTELEPTELEPTEPDPTELDPTEPAPVPSGSTTADGTEAGA